MEQHDANLPIEQQETFVHRVFASVDEASVCELAQLRSKNGIVPSCERGCPDCCSFFILTSVAEGHTLAQYVKREFSETEIGRLRLRTEHWHDWDSARPGRHAQPSTSEREDLSGYKHACPMLVENVCSAYPVRPVVCRTHFVCSPPERCGGVNDPASLEAAPVVLHSVVSAAGPFARALEAEAEDAGLDFSRSLMLLPHRLAIEMNWDFAISP